MLPVPHSGPGRQDTLRMTTPENPDPAVVDDGQLRSTTADRPGRIMSSSERTVHHQSYGAPI